MPADREAITRVKVEGADAAAADVKKVADAQRDQADAAKEQQQSAGGADATEKQAQATEKLTEKTEGLTSSEQDLKDVLNQIHPAFGGLIDGMRGAMKLAGDLGEKNLKLGGIIDTITGAVKGNASAFLLLGVGSAAFLAVSQVYSKWQDLRKEAEATKRAVEEYIQLQSQMAGEGEQTRGELAAGLIARGQATPQALDEAATREQQLRNAGLGAVSVQAAVAGAGSGADLGGYLSLAAAMQRGYVKPEDADAMGALQGVMEDKQKAAELQQAVALQKSEQDRRQAEAREQFNNFRYKKAGMFGRDDLLAFGQNDEIMRVIEQDYGLTGDQATQALAVARQLMARFQEKQLLTSTGTIGFVPFQGAGGGRAYELPETDYQRVDPVVEQIADTLFERFQRPGQDGGTTQGGAAPVVIHHHHTTNRYNERHYGTRRGPWNVRSGQSERDRSRSG